jgi:hypothetical protein
MLGFRNSAPFSIFVQIVANEDSLNIFATLLSSSNSVSASGTSCSSDSFGTPRTY